MSERDELARKLDEWLDDEAPLNLRRYVPVADAILAAGYRRPRTVTTVEELDALANESLILDATSKCREGLTSIEGRNWWRAMGPSKVLESKDIALPATVLHEPEATK